MFQKQSATNVLEIPQDQYTSYPRENLLVPGENDVDPVLAGYAQLIADGAGIPNCCDPANGLQGWFWK